MSITKYTAFLKTVECQSLTKAASELGYTQPGISHMIRALEEDFGLRLLLRKKDGVYPTRAAQELICHMQQIVNGEAKLREAAQQIRGIDRGSLRIGCYNSISIHWLPEVMGEYLTLHPNIDLSVQTGVHDELYRQLQRDTIDLALMSKPVPQNTKFLPLMRDSLMAVLPSDHPLAAQKNVPLEDLVRFPFIMPAEGSGEDVWQLLEREQLKCNIRFKIKGDRGILQMISRGFGVSLMSRFLLDQVPPNVVIRELETPCYRELGVAIPAGAQYFPATIEFIHMIQKIISTQDSEGCASKTDQMMAE